MSRTTQCCCSGERSTLLEGAFLQIWDLISSDVILILVSRAAEQDAEMMRLQILGDPNLMRMVRQVLQSTPYTFSMLYPVDVYMLQTQPELAEAVSDPQRFAELLRGLSARRLDQERQRQLEIARLNADPFDVEAQQRIEEAIQQEAILENLEHAIEYSPESFGRVTML